MLYDSAHLEQIKAKKYFEEKVKSS